MKRARVLAFLFAACLTAACDAYDTAVDSTESAYSEQQFRELCANKAGLTINDVDDLGGVEASIPRVDEALWLLFDVGAPFVEMERTLWNSNAEDMASWSPLIADPVQLWRFERKPEGDASCTPFRAWLNTQKTAQGVHKVISGRWLDAASYQGQCVKFTAAPLSAKSAFGYRPGNIPYRLQEESFFVQRVGGCGFVSQTDRALVDSSGSRLFQLRSLRMTTNAGCLTKIGGYSGSSYSCSEPEEENLFQGKNVLVDTSTKSGEEKLQVLKEGCRQQASCQHTK